MLEHYRCQRYIPKDSRLLSISDTIKFCHQHITQPSVTTEDRILHGIEKLTSALQGKSSSTSADQLAAIQFLQDVLGKWSGNLTLDNREPPAPPPPTQQEKWAERRAAAEQQPSPRVEPRAPRVQPPTLTVQAPAPRVPRILPTVLPVPQTLLPDPQPVAKRLDHAKCPVCRNLPRHHLNPWGIAPSHVCRGLSQFTLPKRPNKSTQRNIWHCGARRYPIWRRCQSSSSN